MTLIMSIKKTYKKIVSHGVLGVLGQSLKKCGRLRQTNDMLATFPKQRNEGA
mgnify:CR=1 FL=1